MDEPKKSKRQNKGPWKASVMAERRKIAETRQFEYDKLSAQEKIARLDEGGLIAKKQRAKLSASLKNRPIER